MRRLTTIIWHMLTHREPYRLGGAPRAKINGSRRLDGSGANLTDLANIGD